jgi:hypothetical protein
MQSELEPARLDAFGQRLRQSKRHWVEADCLWSAFAEAFPTLAQSSDRRQWLLAALGELDRQQVIKLPSGKGRRWDGSLKPAIPTSVYVVRSPEAVNRESWKIFPWHARLRWVSGLPRLTTELEQFLLRVHRGLVRGEFEVQAPLKYRSLQLTGREKRLGELTQTGLFGPGRLDLHLLGCFSETPPMACETVSDAPTLVVFENCDSFAVARNVLRSLANPPFGMVGFGGGNGIVRSLPSLRVLGKHVQRIVYVGDLDGHGLRIAARASRAAARAGLPCVEPATELHSAMLEAAARFGHSDGWKDGSAQRPNAEKLITLLRFLSPPLREAVARIIIAGNRIPEEVLGPAELQAVWR